MFVEPDPFLLVEEGFAGEGPALDVEEFLLVAVTLEHDVALLADALDFAERGLKLENAEVVERGEGDDEVEGFVLEGIGILGAVQEKVGLELGMHAGEAVFGDVKSDDLKSGLEELHFVKEKAFPASDIEHARTGFEPVGVDESLGNGFPAASEILVTTVAEPTVAIPVIELIFLGLQHAGNLVVDHPSDNIAVGGFVKWRNEMTELGHRKRNLKLET